MLKKFVTSKKYQIWGLSQKGLELFLHFHENQVQFMNLCLIWFAHFFSINTQCHHLFWVQQQQVHSKIEMDLCVSPTTNTVPSYCQKVFDRSIFYWLTRWYVNKCIHFILVSVSEQTDQRYNLKSAKNVFSYGITWHMHSSTYLHR